MKSILIIFLAFLLQACVGASLLTSHHGTKFSHPENEYSYSSSFKSIAYGYSTADIDDPGIPLKLGNLEVVSNCYKENVITFSPSFVIPFPPVIPLFYPSEDSLSEYVQITLNGIGNEQYKVVSLLTSNRNSMLYREIDNKFTFDTLCKDLSRDSKITIQGPDGPIEIGLELIKVYNFSWMWLSA